jgi:hypothetical protein
MARKKKVEEVKIVYIVDISKLSLLKKDKYVEQAGQFLEEQIPSSTISKDGNILSIEVPEKISKKMFKLRLNKFLYSSGLKDEFRLISLNNDKGNGFQIMNR